MLRVPTRPLPYGRQNITEADVAAVVASLHADYLTQGPTVAEFEKQFAAYIGAQYAVAVSNGTAALHLCALALNVQPGQRVITTPLTFSASANCVRYCGGEVHFADIDPATGLIDLNKVRALLEANPKGHFTGLIPVDFAGLAVDLEKARQLANEFGLWIIEDSCHSPGGFFVDSQGREQRCGNGNFADLAIFSFHPVKHIATGEGGMVTTNSEALFHHLLRLRTHGITRNPADLIREPDGGWYMEMQELGYNYRLPDFNCALGLSQLARADEGLARRRQLAAQYDTAFAQLPVPHGAGPRPPRPRLPPLRHSSREAARAVRLPENQADFRAGALHPGAPHALLRRPRLESRRFPVGRKLLRALPQHPPVPHADR